MEKKHDVKVFDNCPALDGYHCQTNSLAKIFHYHNCPLSEEMLLGHTFFQYIRDASMNWLPPINSLFINVGSYSFH